MAGRNQGPSKTVSANAGAHRGSGQAHATVVQGHAAPTRYASVVQGHAIAAGGPQISHEMLSTIAGAIHSRLMAGDVANARSLVASIIAMGHGDMGIFAQLVGLHNELVEGRVVAGPSGYTGGAWGGIHSPASNSGGDPTAGLMALLTGGNSRGSGDFGLSSLDLVTQDSGHDLARPTWGADDLHRPTWGADDLANPYPPPAPPPPPPIEEPPNIDEGQGGKLRIPEPSDKSGKPDPKKASYDPDAAGPSGSNRFYQPAYTPPKTRGGSTGDSEFGGSAATGPSGGRAGPRLGVPLNDAPARATPNGPSAMVAHLPRFFTPGGYSGR